MKKMLTLAFVGMLSFSAFSQKGTTFNAGLELAMPMGDLKEVSSMGIGASAKALFGMSDKTAITGSVGFISFSGKDVSGYKFPTWSFIPVKVGYKIGFDGGFYVEPQVGMTFISIPGESTSAFTYAPNIGYATKSLDFSLRYESASKSSGGTTSSLSHLGLRVAYSFGGK